MQNTNYLTESTLGTFLQLNPYFYDQGCEWIYDKSVPGSNIKNRPDYRCEKLKLIVEFDGYLHYSQMKSILNDYKKDEVYKKLGYKVIRIPYFVQLEPRTIKQLFGFDNDYPQDYPHGFIDDKALLPCDFCEEGIRKFVKDLNKFDVIYDDIVDSLKAKVKHLGNVRLVIPDSLEFILK